ncbi:MAG TPA: hypothetical protein VHT91_42670 [Kofleriaceae bacterium]|nr:hypothetical protein [Kofleriaceae bacterium]
MHPSTALRAPCALLIVLSAACGGSQPAAHPDGGSQVDAEPPDALPDGSATDGAPGAGPGASVTVAVSGPGRVTSTPPGIDCGAGATACSAQFTAPTIVLTTDDATTVRWSGDCSGNGDCALALGESRTITAQTFAPVQRTFDGPDHGADACFAIAAGPGDSIVVAGQIARIAQGQDAWARAYDAAGNALWTYELSTPSEGHDAANGVVALPDGGALVAGTWFSGSNTHWNSFAVDVSAGGAAAWSQVNEIVGDDTYNAIARDASGRLVMAGSLAEPDGPEAWVRAATADGSQLWGLTRHGTGPGGATATGIAADSTGDVVAVGTESNVDTGTDGWIAKYSPAGVQRWSQSLASPGPDPDTLRAIAIGPDDSIAAVGGLDGESTIRVYAADGTPRWDATAADGTSWGSVAVDAAGNVVVAGSLGADLIVRKYTPAGAMLWQRKLAAARGNAVAIDSHGNVLVCGAITTAGNTDMLIAVFPQ